MSMKNSNGTIWNRSCDLPVCSAVPQSLRHCVPLMSTRNISWGVEAAGALGRQTHHFHALIFLKSGNFNHLKSSRSLQACTRIAWSLMLEKFFTTPCRIFDVNLHNVPNEHLLYNLTLPVAYMWSVLWINWKPPSTPTLFYMPWGCKFLQKGA
jgi:hypothetical protein